MKYDKIPLTNILINARDIDGDYSDEDSSITETIFYSLSSLNPSWQGDLIYIPTAENIGEIYEINDGFPFVYSSDQIFGSFDDSGEYWEFRKFNSGLLEKTLEKVMLENALSFRTVFDKSREFRKAREKCGALINEKNPDIIDAILTILKGPTYYFEPDIEYRAKIRYYNEIDSELGIVEIEKSKQRFFDTDLYMINELSCFPRGVIYRVLMNMSPYFNIFVPFAERVKVFREMYKGIDEQIENINDEEIIQALRSADAHEKITTLHKATLKLGFHRFIELTDLADSKEIGTDFKRLPKYEDEIENFLKSEIKPFIRNFVKWAWYIAAGIEKISADLKKEPESNKRTIRKNNDYDDDDYYRSYDDDLPRGPEWLGGVETEEEFWEHG